jgi:excisionase family DNA binding protein
MSEETDHESAIQLLHHTLYTPEELSRLLGMSLQQIRHAARAHELQATIVDHHVICIRRDDVVEWLRRTETQ